MKKIVFISLLLGLIIFSGCGVQKKVQINSSDVLDKNKTNQNSNKENNNNVKKNNGANVNSNDNNNIVDKNKVNEVEIKNFLFTPQNLKIKKGETVVWTNVDPVPHLIKADTFSSENLLANQRYSYKFENIGTYEYHCAIHPSMIGEVIVE